MKLSLEFRLPWEKAAPAAPPKAAARVPQVAQRLRLSQDDPQNGVFAGLQLLAPPDQENRWRDLTLDQNTLDRMAPADLMELLCDLSPDISKALWDFLRFFNPGWTLRAVGKDKKTVDEGGQALLDAFAARLSDLYGAADVVFNRLAFTAFLRGGLFAEIVLDKAGREAIDLATPDPRWLNFQRARDPLRGLIWVPYQWQQGQKVRLDVPTVRYVPVDPFPGSPYGRALASPALFTTVFLLGLLHDLRRVVQQQGYPRLDIAIVMEELAKAMPPDIRNDPVEIAAWLASVQTQVESAYNALQPDDAFIHADWITVNKPVGAVDTSSLGAIDGLMKALERMAVRALKSTPLLMGTTEGVSEANANRQYESFVSSIRAIQHLAEQLLEHLLGVVLRAAGSQASPEFRFAESRASEELRDAQAEALRIQNASNQFLAGWIDNDAAAQKGAGVEKADKPEPRGMLAAKAGSNPGNTQPDPGANREANSSQNGNGYHGPAEAYSLRDLGERFNPNHDPHSGEFASGGGGGAAAALGAGPEPAPRDSVKAMRAKQHAKLTDAAIQRYSEEHNEPILAKGLNRSGAKANSMADNQPHDVERKVGGKVTDGIELKTMCHGENGKLTMKKSARDRKAEWMKENGADFHTVVFDDRKVYNAKGDGKHGPTSDRVMYYKRGFGSFRISNMHPVSDMAELHSLIDTPAASLPKKAQPLSGYSGQKAAPLSFVLR